MKDLAPVVAEKAQKSGDPNVKKLLEETTIIRGGAGTTWSKNMIYIVIALAIILGIVSAGVLIWYFKLRELPEDVRENMEASNEVLMACNPNEPISDECVLKEMVFVYNNRKKFNIPENIGERILNEFTTRTNPSLLDLFKKIKRPNSEPISNDDWVKLKLEYDIKF